ncbi:MULTISPECIES: ABC transporter ATP-binding protein [unclassified Actinomyces]|uniref:ABC transporter ATP-binding protein n=1 Tax=unclassified Actinomyces TaxID=2609248 RepID=UPI000D5980EA|nr:MULTISPECIES: ABC transporter ATP-binding protein [unclassified Actinomyces]RAX22821.1 ABC transporter ATP-binding protein [Actinomyces sp. Z3]
MSPTAPIIDIHDLTKTFGRGHHATRALDGLDLTLAPGEVSGFLGPNGAGKTTTLRILLGMIRADGGRVRLFGADPWTRAAVLHERLAYVPGDVALWPGLTGAQTLEALASLRPGGNQARAVRRRSQLVERFDLDPSKKVRAYSKGNRQKVALIAALSQPVELLVLDEPTAGLDPLMEEVFSQCVAEAADRGTAVLLSSHILSEVDRLCDTVTIIRAGRTVEQGTLAHIRSLLRTRVHAVVAEHPAGLDGQEGIYGLVFHPLDETAARAEGSGAADATRRGTASRSGADAPGSGETGWEITFSVDSAHSPQVMHAVAALGVRSLTAAPPSLEELFLRHYDPVTTEGAEEAGPGGGGNAVPAADVRNGTGRAS